MHAEFGFEIGFVPSENSSLTSSMRDNENVITYNRGFSWSTNPKKTFLIARV